jgi:hypothetical protein
MRGGSRRHRTRPARRGNSRDASLAILHHPRRAAVRRSTWRGQCAGRIDRRLRRQRQRGYSRRNTRDGDGDFDREPRGSPVCRGGRQRRVRGRPRKPGRLRRRRRWGDPHVLVRFRAGRWRRRRSLRRTEMPKRGDKRGMWRAFTAFFTTTRCGWWRRWRRQRPGPLHHGRWRRRQRGPLWRHRSRRRQLRRRRRRRIASHRDSRWSSRRIWLLRTHREHGLCHERRSRQRWGRR